MKKILYILAMLSDQDVDWMLNAGKRRILHSGEVLIKEGQPANALMIITKGKMSISVKGKIIAEVDEGEIMGEISLLDARPPSATATALGEVTILEIRFSVLQAKLDSDEKFAARLYHVLGILLAQRLRQNNRQLAIAQGAAMKEEEVNEAERELLGKITLERYRFQLIMDKFNES